MGTVTHWPPLLVEECWWEGWSCSALCPGAIVAVDFSDDAGRFFILQLDREDYTYPMRYDDVFFYADEEDMNFHKFHLQDDILESCHA